MKTILPTAACLLLLLGSCSPDPNRRWGEDRNAMTNQSIAEVLAAKLREDLPGGGTLLVIKHPRSAEGTNEPSEARFLALQNALKGSPFTFRTGGVEIPAYRREEKDPAFVDVSMDGFWSTVCGWAGRESSPAAVVVLQPFSPIPTPAELVALPPLYGIAPMPDPSYAEMVAAGEAKLILVQSNNGAAMMAAEKDFEKKSARERVALFYEILE